MNQIQEKEPELDFQFFLQLLQRRKWVVIFTCAVSIALSVYVAIISPATYVVSTKLIYQSASKSGSGIAALASLAGMSMGTGNDASAYLSDILKSGEMLGKLLDREWKTSLALKDTAQTLTLERLWDVKSDTLVPNWRERRREGMLGRLDKDDYIMFEQDKKTGLILLVTEFEDPRLSYDVNVFLFQELNRVLIEDMLSKATDNRKFIEARLKEVKVDLIRSENVLLGYRERNRDRLDPLGELSESRLQRDVMINEQVMAELQKQYEMAKIEEAKDMPVLEIIDAPRMPVEKNKPKRKKIVVIGALAGIVFGSVLALGLDLLLKHRRGVQN